MSVVWVTEDTEILPSFFVELVKHKIEVLHVQSFSEALKVLEKNKNCSGVFLDIQSDLDFFHKKWIELDHKPPVIVYALKIIDKKHIERALTLGFKTYLSFPPDVSSFLKFMDKLHSQPVGGLFKDPEILKVIDIADRVASSMANVLITGESGTGKEIMARYIHQKSQRAKQPFIAVNCAAIPENLLESELFGHEKGAFTGALQRRIGKIEDASGGTLLLDEITEMSPALQAKLLRVLQEREIDRVGGSKPIAVNFRLIATSNRSIKNAIQENMFREDLYFRINVISLVLPPLRKRPEDLAFLADHFIEKYAKDNKLAVPKLSENASQALKDYDWPGNIRELENTMHRAILVCRTQLIDVEDLGLIHDKNREKEDGLAGFVGDSLESIERRFINVTLEFCKQDVKKAAGLLDLSVEALEKKLQKKRLAFANDSAANAFHEKTKILSAD